MGTVYHRLLTGPTPRFLFFCLLSFESTLVALTIEQSLLIFLPEPMLIFWQEFMHFHECVTCLHTIFLLFFPVLLMLLKAALWSAVFFHGWISFLSIGVTNASFHVSGNSSFVIELFIILINGKTSSFAPRTNCS